VASRVLALVSFGKTPTTLVFLFTSLKSRSTMLVVRRAWRVVASREGEVGEGVPYAGLEDGDRLRKALPVKLRENSSSTSASAVLSGA
jgi:hypothetical protein